MAWPWGWTCWNAHSRKYWKLSFFFLHLWIVFEMTYNPAKIDSKQQWLLKITGDVLHPRHCINTCLNASNWQKSAFIEVLTHCKWPNNWVHLISSTWLISMEAMIIIFFPHHASLFWLSFCSVNNDILRSNVYFEALMHVKRSIMYPFLFRIEGLSLRLSLIPSCRRWGTLRPTSSNNKTHTST